MNNQLEFTSHEELQIQFARPLRWRAELWAKRNTDRRPTNLWSVGRQRDESQPYLLDPSWLGPKAHRATGFGLAPELLLFVRMNLPEVSRHGYPPLNLSSFGLRDFRRYPVSQGRGPVPWVDWGLQSPASAAIFAENSRSSPCSREGNFSDTRAEEA